jgi:ABC-type branched-subunit amino acid transport system ATPase component
MLERVGGRLKTCVVSPNGAGKSSHVVCVAALFVPYAFPRGKVRITTADAKQLDDQIIPGLERHLPKFAGWKVSTVLYKVSTPQKEYCGVYHG